MRLFSTILAIILLQNIVWPASQEALLRHQVDKEATAYLRIPAAIDQLLPAKGKEQLNRLQKDRAHQQFMGALDTKIQDHQALQLILKEYGIREYAKEISHVIALFSHIDSPFELVVSGSNPETFHGYLTVGFQAKSIDQLNETLTNFEIPFVFDASGWLEFPMGGTFYFDQKQGRLFGYLAQNSSKEKLESWKETLTRHGVSSNDSFTKLEKRIDPSGTGFFLWGSVRDEVKETVDLFSDFIDSPVVEYFVLNPHIEAFGVGMGENEMHQGQFSFLVEADTTALLGSEAITEFNNKLQTVGEPSFVSTMVIPSNETVKAFIKSLASFDEEFADYPEEFDKAITEVEEKIGINPLLILEALGPEVYSYRDETGYNSAIRIRDKKAYKKMIEAYKGLAHESRDLPYNIIEFKMKNEYRAALEELISDRSDRESMRILAFLMPKVFGLQELNLFFSQYETVYFKEENGWLHSSRLPQTLMERKKARYPISKWLKSQSYSPEKGLIGISFKVQNAYRDYYYRYLKQLQNLNDDLQLGQKIEELPVFSELGIKGDTRIGFLVNYEPEYIGFTYHYDASPLDLSLIAPAGAASTVAVTGILAMFALPAYQDYTKRVLVAEGIQLSAAAKSAVTEYYAVRGVWPDSNEEAGLADANEIHSNAVLSVEIIGDGLIEVTYNSQVSWDYPTLLLRATDKNGMIHWSCDEGTVNDKYRPSMCRR